MASLEPKPNADALAQRLQESLRRRRFRPWRIGALVFVAALLAAAALAWSLFHERPVLALQVVALASVVAAGEPAQARAVLVTAEAPDAPVPGAGHDMIFLPPAPPGATPVPEKTVTDREGYAAMRWPLPAAAREVSFLARHVDVRRRRGSTDSGHIYVWPRASVLLLLDVEEVLADVPAAWGRDPFAVALPLRPGAAEALHTLRDEIHIVYLCPASASWLRFLRLRSGVEALFESQLPLPRGPVFGRLDFARADSADGVRRAAVAELRRHFDAPPLAVVNQTASLTLYQELGVRTLWLGPAPPAAPLAPAATWRDFPTAARRLLAK
jgi:hypothetical protein